MKLWCDEVLNRVKEDKMILQREPAKRVALAWQLMKLEKFEENKTYLQM